MRGINTEEEDFIRTLRGSVRTNLQEAYEMTIFFCKMRNYTLRDKCNLLRQLFTDEQVRMIEDAYD